ncbi:MAG: hypothetical protein Q9227_000847 [Pyrenula ochraceoflavens]
MSQIYSNSFITISATGALDGTQGCFIPRKNPSRRPCLVTPLVAQLGTNNSVCGADSRLDSSVKDRQNDEACREKSAQTSQAATSKDNESSSLNLARVSEDDYDAVERHQRSSQDGDNTEDSFSTEILDKKNRQTAVLPAISSSPSFIILPTFLEWTQSWSQSMKGPLLSRGWTLQERELSARIVHFTTEQVVWECRECYASEDDPMQTRKPMLFNSGLNFRLLDSNMKDRKDRPDKYKFLKWMDLVQEYSTRKLLIKSDKLRAIAGLADAIRAIQQDDFYISGLW